MDRKQALEQALKVARVEEAAAREAEARAWDVLRASMAEEQQRMERVLTPLRAEIHETYLDRTTKMRRTQTLACAASLSAEDMRILAHLENATAAQVSPLFHAGLVKPQGPTRFTLTLLGEHTLAVLREFPLEEVQS